MESKLKLQCNILMGMLKAWFEQGMDLPKAELLQMAERLLDGAAAQMM